MNTRHSLTVSPHDIAGVISRLTDRDHQIITVLGDHHVLTTNQLAAMYFGSLSRAHQRLRLLYRLGVLNRFRHPASRGSFGYRWVLAHLGWRIHAAATEQKSPTSTVVNERLLSIAASPKLAHLLGSNDFFVRLHAATRNDPYTEILDWWNEQHCTEICGGLVRPDGHATLRHGTQQVSFWYEHDTGTETHQQLQRKLDRYARLIHPSAQRPILIELPTPAREAHLHDTLVPPGNVAIATTHCGIADDPTSGIWRAFGAGAREILLNVAYL